METKKCINCGRELPLSDFHKNKNSKDGLRNICKECANAHARKYYKNKVSNSLRLNGMIGGGEEQTPNQIIDEIRERAEVLRGIGFNVNIEINYTKTIKL